MEKIGLLDKNLLIEKIRKAFLDSQKIKFQRSLCEFFADDGSFIGDNVFETSFVLQEDCAPLVYEVSGPYDSISNEYATVARLYHKGELRYVCDIKPGIMQRTGAMVQLYFDALGHQPANVLIIGAGKVAASVLDYLKFFNPGLTQVSYFDSGTAKETFVAEANKNNIQLKKADAIDLAAFDTVIMATNTKDVIITEENLASLPLGSVVVSLCTTSQTGEIAESVYGLPQVRLFLDYELSKSFTADMQRAQSQGVLDQAILFNQVLQGASSYELSDKINIIRLTGTPMQNIALLEAQLADNPIGCL